MVFTDAGGELFLLYQHRPGERESHLPGGWGKEQLSGEGAEQRCLEGAPADVQEVFRPGAEGEDEQGGVREVGEDGGEFAG